MKFPHVEHLELGRLFHSVKSIQMQSFFWSAFSWIQSEYRKIWNRKNSIFGHFSRSCSQKPHRLKMMKHLLTDEYYNPRKSRLTKFRCDNILTVKVSHNMNGIFSGSKFLGVNLPGVIFPGAFLLETCST